MWSPDGSHVQQSLFQRSQCPEDEKTLNSDILQTHWIKTFYTDKAFTYISGVSREESFSTTKRVKVSSADILASRTLRSQTNKRKNKFHVKLDPAQ